ncbi:MAG: hypothetical protein H6743_01975 [Rickettsiaceae bacterium]|nr:hypothetical protein [Rickettsiaceae bacterium]
MNKFYNIPFVTSSNPIDLIVRFPDKINNFLEILFKGVNINLLKLLDQVSKKWLLHNKTPYFEEIEMMANHVNCSGIYFLNTLHEWGCTTRVGPNKNGQPTMWRVLDWPLYGLGANALIINRELFGAPCINLGWPLYSGIVNLICPGRFCIAINQAPKFKKFLGGIELPEYALSIYQKLLFLSKKDILPSHLVRIAGQVCNSFSEALDLLCKNKTCIPAIFIIVGTKSTEYAIVEHQNSCTTIFNGPMCVANHWRFTPPIYEELSNSFARENALKLASLNQDFSWLIPPILNRDSRLAMIITPVTGFVKGVSIE